MADPDSSRSVGTGISFFAALLVFCITLLVFYNHNKIPRFSIVIWFLLPLISYLIASCTLFLSQYMSCSSVDSRKAFLGGLWTAGASGIALLLSSFTWFRLPVASAIGPAFVRTPTNVVTNGATKANEKGSACCPPTYTLESLESTFPLVKGASYGFYLFFSILFGITLGNGSAMPC